MALHKIQKRTVTRDLKEKVVWHFCFCINPKIKIKSKSLYKMFVPEAQSFGIWSTKKSISLVRYLTICSSTERSLKRSSYSHMGLTWQVWKSSDVLSTILNRSVCTRINKWETRGSLETTLIQNYKDTLAWWLQDAVVWWGQLVHELKNVTMNNT